MRELFRFFKFFYQLRGLTIFYLLFVMVAAALFETLGVGLFLPILEGGSLDNPVGEILLIVFEWLNIEYSLSKLLLLMVFFFFLRSIFLVLKGAYIGKITSDLLVDLRIETVRQVFEANYLYFLSKDTGYINNAATVEFARLAFALKVYANVLLAFILSFMYLAWPLLLNPAMVVGIGLLGVPALFFIRKINQKTRKYALMTSEHSAGLQSILIQSLQQFKYLKSTHSEEQVLHQIDRESQTLGELRFKQSVLQAITENGFTPFTILIVAGVLFYQMEVAGGDTAQTLFFLLLLQRAMAQLLGSQGKYRKFLGSVGSINVYKTLTQELEENNEAFKPDGAKPDFSQPIEFKNVTYKYPTGDIVLQNINLLIPPKSTVAFVGASGAGKSTLATLLTGILGASEGQILLGHESYANIDQQQLRQRIGYVTQESVIFNDTIKNNITLWSPNGSDEKLRTAATRAHIKDFIEQLPHGYESPLGDNGLNISGGQRQRISIARELYKDVKLLIFDEATSSLDTDSEREIQRNIDELRGEKTIVLIAHRLSTVRNSDLIFVLKDGRIVEQGSYEQLYQRHGEFRRMVDLQSTAAPEKNAS
ncbi:MAG: ABC transporter ATP-binding protein [Ardenticatenaceae bacterium]